MDDPDKNNVKIGVEIVYVFKQLVASQGICELHR